MPLTQDFKISVRDRAQRDSEFRQALLKQAVECILNNDLPTGRSLLRMYVHGTIGFQELEKRTQIPIKSLMRMLGPNGSPNVANLTNILSALKKAEGVSFALSLPPVTGPSKSRAMRA